MTHKELITQMLEALIKASALLDMRGTAYSDVDEAINVSTEYLAAPEQSEPLTFGWLTACDEEMIGAHLGVANLSDSYESAKAKLRTLIDWHVAVATDPAVNGKPSSQPKAEPVNQMLLDALKQMLALDEEDHQRYPGDEDVCQEVRAARAAIAAAEQAPQSTSLTSLLKHKDVQAALLAAQKKIPE